MAKPKSVISFCGGGQCGVFSAGVAEELDKANIQPKLQAVVAGSAGSVAAMALLTHDTHAGLDTFLEFASSGSVNGANIPAFATGHVWSLCTREKHQPDRHVVNIDGIMEVAGRHVINIDVLRKQAVECLIRVLHLPTEKTHLVDLRTHPDPDAILRASIHFRPYCVSPKNESPYMDACVGDPIGLPEITERFPKEKIVTVVNTPPDKIQSMTQGVVYGLLGVLTGDRPLCRLYGARTTTVPRSLTLAERNPDRFLTVFPPDDFAVGLLTSSPRILRKAYQQGQKKAEEVLRFLDA